MTQDKPDEGWQSLAEVTAKIINTYLTNNHASITAEELPKLVGSVRAALEPAKAAIVQTAIVQTASAGLRDGPLKITGDHPLAGDYNVVGAATGKQSSLKDLVDSHVKKHGATLTKLTNAEAESLIIEEAERVAASRPEPEIIPPHKPTQQPAVPIGQEVSDDYIVCLEEGKRCRSMKGHLRAKHNLTPEQYRKKWGLPETYSMVPPNYSAVRRQISNQVWKQKKKDRP